MSKSITIGTTVDGGNAFKLPLDFATESCAVIARKGAGKTHVGRVCAEDLIEHVPVVIIDPLDVWWGLRLSKDGKKEGCQFVIFGGSHADLPLVEGAGKHLADLIVDRGISAIFVVDHLSLAAQRRFVADFVERMYERKSATEHRTAIYLIIDEADSFAPQRVMPDMARCCGVVDRLVRRGRSRGIGSMCISQRPAVINKDVLSQTEILICLQVTAPQDKDALNEWIKSNADKVKATGFMDSLPLLPRGRAWVWSPSQLKIFEQVNIRDTRTYDSSYTPKVGERQKASPKLTPVDFKVINEQLAEVLKEAEANDPTVLKKRLKALEQELRSRERDLTIREKEKQPVDKQSIQHAVDKAVKAATQKADEAMRKLWIRSMEGAQREANHAIQKTINEAFRAVIAEAGGAASNAAAVVASHVATSHPPAKISYGAVGFSGEVSKSGFKAENRREVPRPTRGPLGDNDDDGEKLGKAHRLIMTALAQHGNLTKTQTALIAGYSAGGGGFLNPLGRLRTLGYVATGTDGSLSITHEGLTELGSYAELPSGPELRAYWGQKLGKAHRLILEALSEAPNYTLDKEELARIAGYSAGGGGFLNPLGKLRTLELVSGSKDITLAEELQ